MKRWPRVGLLSPCGHGNLGDAAIQQAVIAELQGRFPGVDIIGITLVPADTVSRHGIRAVPIGAVSTPHYGIVATAGDRVAADRSRDGIPGRSADSQSRVAPPGILARIGLWAVRALLPKGLPWALRQEWRHWRLAWSTVGDLDWLVVSGGGQLDDFWGGPWGHPWAMFKWTLLARIARCRVLVVSVGAGTAGSALSRFLMRQVLRLAHYRSFRDEGSRDIVKAIGFHRRDDPVLPDLAYGVSEALARELAPADAPAARRVAIAPMAYARPGTWPATDAERYRLYVRKLSELSVRLLEDGHRVSLIHSDGPDARAVADVHELIATHAPEACRASVDRPETKRVDQYLAACRASDLVVASRLHGVILSHVAGTPVLALSYDRKVRAAMSDAGQAEHCLDIDGFSVLEAHRAVASMLAREDEHRATVESQVRAFRERLAIQYDRIFPRAAAACTA